MGSIGPAFACRGVCAFALVVGLTACGAGDNGGPSRPRSTIPGGHSGTGAAAAGGAQASGGSSAIPNGGGGRSSASTAGRSGRNNECANAMVNTSTTTPDILFVIDGSGSMCANFGGSTRWQALRSALLDPMNGLVQRLQASAQFGMVLYDGTIDLLLALTAVGGSNNPECALMYTATKAEGQCPQLIEVPIALNNAPALDMAFPQTELGGSTPTDKAMGHAVDLLVGMQSGDPDAEQNPQYIILATDGSPNDICVGGVGGDGATQKQGVIAAVDRAQMSKITTFVISLAGDDQALGAHLEEVAKHGDPMNPMAHAFSPMTPDDLVNTLAALLGGAIGCNIVLDGMVTQGMECKGFVEVNGNELPCCKENAGMWTCDDMPVAAPDGWRLKDPGTVELIGNACTNFLRSPSAMLRAGFPCGIFVPE